MIAATTWHDVLVAWPLAFSVGVVVGLAAASRWRIVRTEDLEERRARD